MSNRWHMNRLGFVNFRLYDREEFPLADGKLLLRGQNGSGKSITTQSFIPFILDGDRTPSRLDPFGSSDRRMEYYFLGEEGKEDETGYLYLEFKREGTEQYRTVGIGQRAQKGKPMSFWGFVILDNQRVGRELLLYRQAGSQRIPLTKQELKKSLGERNLFTDNQGEYKNLVNRHIFGFERLEQYDQFIRLLVKVRAPKLSKEFKPTRIYEILNDSLQTLSDEDLRPMVDAMETLDDMQARLQGVRQSLKDTQIIRNEYTRYNQYLLAVKGRNYLKAKSQCAQAAGELEKSLEDRREKEEERCRREERMEELRGEGELLAAERDSLNCTDLEEAAQRLQEAKEKRSAAGEERQTWEEKARESRERLLEYDRALRELEGKREVAEEELQEGREELTELQESVAFEGHDRLLAASDSRELPRLLQEIRQLERQIKSGEEALRLEQEAEAAYGREAEKLQLAQAEVQRAEAEKETAGEKKERAREELTEVYFSSRERWEEFDLSEEELGRIEELLCQYQSPADRAPVREIEMAARERKRGELLEQKARSQRLCREAEEERKEAEGELLRLQSAPELTPARSPETEQAREVLKEQGVRFCPLYQAVDFSEDMEPGQRDLLEAQLADAGLLDRLIVAGEDREKADRLLGALSDALILTGEKLGGEGTDQAPGAFPGLKPDPEADPLIQEAVKEFLSQIGGGALRSGCLLSLSPDGRYRHGAVAGHSLAVAEASFVGAAARRRRKEAACRELREKIARLLSEEEGRQEEIRLSERRLNTLEEEYQSLPSYQELDGLIEAEREALWAYEKAGEALKEQEEQEEQSGRRWRELRQKALEICRLLPYERTVRAYGEAASDAEDYRDCASRMERLLLDLAHTCQLVNQSRELSEREEQAADDYMVQIRRLNRQIEELSTSIEKLQEFLEKPENRERARRLQEILETLLLIRKESDETDRRLAVLQDHLERAEGEISRLRETAVQAAARENKLRSYFSEELALKLLMERGEKSLESCAKEAQGLLREADRGKSHADLMGSLMHVYQKYSASLVNYGLSLEDCFEDDGEDSAVLRKRQRVAAVWRGRKLYLEEFYTALRENAEETEQLIREKDRELFENVLSRTLSQQMTARISESRLWIRDMSALMQEMDTSMGLKFSLDWRPRQAEGEGELDTAELEKLLTREKDLLTADDMERVAEHFRSRVRAEKERAEEKGEPVNYQDLVRDALDYRKWFEFRMFFSRGEEGKKPLTNSAFNKFSGGEKAMAMYVPLFAAVNAQYRKSRYDDYPKMIALDEAFAGVDDKNISSMFELVGRLGFDYIMNSQALWGCYETVPKLRIAELKRPANAQMVVVIYYYWNGRKKVLEDQL